MLEKWANLNLEMLIKNSILLIIKIMKQELTEGRYFGNTESKRETDRLILSETSYNPFFTIPCHYHKNHYLCYVLKGDFSEFSSKKEIACTKGDIIIHPRYQEHSNFFSKSGGLCFNVEMTGMFQKELSLLNISSYQVLKKENPFIKSIVDRIYMEFKNYDCFSEWIIEGLLLELMGTISRQVHDQGSSYWFKKAKKIIDENYGKEVSTAFVAGELNVSASHLAREFRKAAGMTLGEYLRVSRIQQACQQLKKQDPDISQIAFELGFTDQSHFTKVFRRQMGITPRKYLLINK